tara:strand:- start:57 stop:1076 length:1020 start_codon:yes stop_codon:yes gene_type:complete
MKKKVLLTGVSGYIGNHCAAELLKNGYYVKGSLRDMSKAERVIAAVKKEVDPKENLDFCELDLLNDKGWDDAVLGCDYVMHVASPFINIEPKDSNIFIKPAVEGTKRALEAAKKAGVKRVVLTSSIVSMLGNANKSMDVNAKTWTNVNAKNVSAYAKSKTLAEQYAWNFVKNQNSQNPMELVVVNPGPVFGPSLSGNLEGTSMKMFKQMLKGEMPMIPQAGMNMSDVRDVAKIQVLALENKEASGNRYLVTTQKAYQFQEISQILKLNGYEKVSTKLAPNFLLNFMGNFNSEVKSMRAFIGKTYTGDITPAMNTFDWEPINFKKTLLDTAKSITDILKK